MGLPSLGLPELLIILVIILLVFGAGKLPEIARGLGKAVGDFRRASQGLDLEEELGEKKEKPES
ncbi:MAG: twin-arginine translocase TatA/TatE family subunit [Anaerolineae bacterium]|nr:twin-arginine translocase TatA/TatE family subunit [Anaerolineae bacterium]NIN96751.1 twin-arginine translocase TatA/TatE family subunit [Anaerolineae bacterium]NIQ79747.1 twin-arginine translocase TatA/TatE family subunit [Anaerolineae bacterium]